MKILALARIKNGTMNLPKEVREHLKIRERDKIVFFLENGKIARCDISGYLHFLC